MADEIVDTLRLVFAPLPDDKREQLVRWATEEVGSRSATQMLTDDAGTVWEIGKESPTNKALTVFAILFDSVTRCFDIYSMAMVEGGAPSEADGRLYFKETCFRPACSYGPLTAGALFDEWETFFDDDEPEPAPAPEPKANGAHA